MAIEWIQNKSPHPVINPGVCEFRIDASTTRGAPPGRLLTEEEIACELKRIQTPVERRTFLIGPFGRKIDPTLGRMRDEDIGFIEAMHRFYEGLGIDTHSCFRREDYGRLGIRNEHAEVIDKLLIDTSHVLTALPGASMSNGTWTEIRYGTAIGKNFLFTFRENDPEVVFQRKVKDLLATTGSASRVAFVTFGNHDELFGYIREAWPLLAIGDNKLNGSNS